MLEIIDIIDRGNLLEIKLGKNKTQWGDDWDDTPYEYNAGEVYDKYVSQTAIGYYDTSYKVITYAKYHVGDNSDMSMADFVDRQNPMFYVINQNEPWKTVDKIYLGDTLSDHKLLKIIETKDGVINYD